MCSVCVHPPTRMYFHRRSHSGNPMWLKDEGLRERDEVMPSNFLHALLDANRDRRSLLSKTTHFPTLRSMVKVNKVVVSRACFEHKQCLSAAAPFTPLAATAKSTASNQPAKHKLSAKHGEEFDYFIGNINSSNNGGGGEQSTRVRHPAHTKMWTTSSCVFQQVQRLVQQGFYITPGNNE